MKRQQYSQKYVFKIHSSRIRNSNWNLELSIEDAAENEELVSLADSEVLRFIRKIKGIDDVELENKVKIIKKNIKKLKTENYSFKNRLEIKKNYKELYDLLFVKEYVNIVMDNNRDFDRLNLKKGFYINGLKYRRLLATTGGAKNNTVIYVSEDIYDELSKRIENGRNREVEIVPAKLEAYKALTCSSSIPVPEPNGILVVHDCITKFKTDVIKVDDSRDGEPSVEYVSNYELELNESDGYGLICPELSEVWANQFEQKGSSGFCIRNAFTKGMVFTFDFLQFARDVANNYIVKDVWGNEIDIRNVQLILTTSMLKLWDSYSSISHYLECCRSNGYSFSITKILPEKLENERCMNYQFLQSLDLSDNDIDELVSLTVTEIKDVLGGDWRKSILFLKGIHLNNDSFERSHPDVAKALMVEPELIKDPFIKEKIYNSIKKSINDAKTGVLKVEGNFSCVSGDPYSLCQSIFGLEVTGLLKSGEFYSKYWIDKDVSRVACFRAPMTCHNNIRILRIKTNKHMEQWYRYMPTVTIFNSWDSTAEALNGLDKDGDHIFTTNNRVILKSIKELPAIVCNQKQAKKEIPDERSLIRANKNSFGDAIGTITNRITSCFDLLPMFDEESDEYKTVQYRIVCGQNYQQNAIDKSKGIISKDMPKEWYSYRSIMSIEDNKKKELYERIVVNKKPYFFIYIYPHVKRQYKKFRSNAEENCYIRFGISLDDLLTKKYEMLSHEEKVFLDYYFKTSPVFLTKSTMNRICSKIECEFKDSKIHFDSEEFDYSILKTDRDYSDNTYDEIFDLFMQYKKKTREFAINKKYQRIDKDARAEKRNQFISQFKTSAYEICNNSEELTNIVLDICYTEKGSKQFAWDVCGEQIIKNLLDRNDYKIQYPRANKDGDIFFGGERYSLHIEDVRGGLIENNNQ